MKALYMLEGALATDGLINDSSVYEISIDQETGWINPEIVGDYLLGNALGVG